MPADFDGDGLIDAAVFRPDDGSWYVRLSSGKAPWRTVVFGAAEDIVLAERFRGGRMPELAAFRPSIGTWYMLDPVSGKTSSFVFGQPGDRPVGASVSRSRS